MPFLLIVLFLYFSVSADNDRREKADSASGKSSLLSSFTEGNSTGHFRCSLQKDGTLLTAGILCNIAALAVDNSISPLTRADVAGLSAGSVNRFDRGATYYYSPTIEKASTALTGAMVVAPFALLANPEIRNNWGPFSTMYLEVLLFSYSLPSFGKSMVERDRPFVYNPSVPIDQKLTKDARGSFFSRHATAAFASAVFLSTQYDSYNRNEVSNALVWTVSLLSASTVGYMRYKAGDHFPTDILAGAAVGGIIGCGVPWLHENSTTRAHVALDPVQRSICFTGEL
jgi:membrane-associated phospholipid phosphatase